MTKAKRELRLKLGVFDNGKNTENISILRKEPME
jgi:hypothetical protein